MKNIKLTELLSGLNSEEFRKLGEFIKSPFFNKSRQIIRLYNALKLLKKSKKGLDQKVIFEKVYGDEKYNDQKIRSLVSDFVKLVMKYVSYTGYQKTPLNQYAIQLKEYRNRNSSKIFKNIYKNLQETSKNIINKNEGYYFFLYSAEHERLEHRGDDIISDYGRYFRDINSNIDYFFMKSKLDLACTMIQRSWFSHEKISFDETWQLKNIMSRIEGSLKDIMTNHPLIYMDYLFIKMSSELKTLKYYRVLKKMLLENIDKMNIEFINEKFLCMQSYLLKKVFDGQLNLKSELIAMKFEFEKKGFFDKLPHMYNVPFFNTIYDRLLAGKIYEAEQFFIKYKEKVSDEYRKQVVKLCEGLIYYYKKDYDNSKIVLNGVDYLNYYFYFRAKATLIQISYDLNEFEAVICYIDSVKHYIKRNAFVIKTHLHYNGFTSFIKIMDKLMKVTLKKPEKLQALKTEFSSLKNLECKLWLSNKISELEVKYASVI